MLGPRPPSGSSISAIAGISEARAAPMEPPSRICVGATVAATMETRASRAVAARPLSADAAWDPLVRTSTAL